MTLHNSLERQTVSHNCPYDEYDEPMVLSSERSVVGFTMLRRSAAWFRSSGGTEPNHSTANSTGFEGLKQAAACGYASLKRFAGRITRRGKFRPIVKQL